MRSSTSVFFLLIFTVCISCNTQKKKADTVKTSVHRQPNIIFIFADDWGYGDLGSHGSTFCETPNLDKMAAEGIDFQNVAVVNPVCSPSRVGVITGQYPARQSVHGHFASVESHMKRNMPDWLDPTAPMLPRMLQEGGYVTAHYGKWHLSNNHVKDAPSPLAYGYDAYGAFNLPGELHQMNPDSTIYKTIDFIKRNKHTPFFVNAWIHATHTPHYPKDKYMKQFSHLNEQQQVYAAVIKEYDDRIGELFSTLKELGIDKNTLVVFSSDNGPEITGKNKTIDDASTGPGLGTYYSVGETAGLKGQKRSLFSGGVRIPFIVRWPGTVQAGSVDKTTALTTVDLLPTFLEVAGIDAPQDYESDGESIIAALTGKEFKRKKPIYWNWRFSFNRTDFWPSAGIQEENWKLLTNKELQRTELYTINTDWAEQHDVAKENTARVDALMEKLHNFEATLPISPPKDCFSKERETLQ